MNCMMPQVCAEIRGWLRPMVLVFHSTVQHAIRGPQVGIFCSHIVIQFAWKNAFRTSILQLTKRSSSVFQFCVMIGV